MLYSYFPTLTEKFRPWRALLGGQLASGVQLDRRARDCVYGLICASIAVISFYDALLVFVFREVIMDFERNPVGRALIEMQQGEVTVFLAAKALGTAVVISVLLFLYARFEKYSYAVASSVAAFQAGLLGYLSLG